MTTTLTQRYIAATVKSLSPAAQVDVRAELEASIADAIEGRVEQGEKREDAERAVLTELGDPAVLAAGYADRPLHLIGPRYYVTWWRLVKLLLMIVPVCVVGGVALSTAATSSADPAPMPENALVTLGVQAGPPPVANRIGISSTWSGPEGSSQGGGLECRDVAGRATTCFCHSTSYS